MHLNGTADKQNTNESIGVTVHPSVTQSAATQITLGPGSSD